MLHSLGLAPLTTGVGPNPAHDTGFPNFVRCRHPFAAGRQVLEAHDNLGHYAVWLRLRGDARFDVRLDPKDTKREDAAQTFGTESKMMMFNIVLWATARFRACSMPDALGPPRFITVIGHEYEVAC